MSSWALTVGRIRLGGSVAGTVDFDRRLNPNVLHRWRREFRQERGNAFPGNRKQRRPAGLICIRGCHVSVSANWFCGGKASTASAYRAYSLLPATALRADG